MNNAEVKEVLLFLLQTAKNHETRLFDNQLLTNAIVDKSAHAPLVLDCYHDKLAQAGRENNGKGIPALQRFDELIHAVHEWKADDQK